MLEKVFIVFMAFACFMSLFAIVVVITQMVQDGKKKRKEERAAKEKATVTEPVVEPVVEEKVEETVEENPVKEEDSNAISFTVTNSSQTLDEKYHALTTEYKHYYDELVQYAMIQDSVKRYKTTRYEDYKIDKTRVVRLQIKRGVVICEFILLNENFKKYITENKVSVKQSPVILRVLDAEAVQAAKNSIDIAVKAVADEKKRHEKSRRTKQRNGRELEQA